MLDGGLIASRVQTPIVRDLWNKRFALYGVAAVIKGLVVFALCAPLVVFPQNYHGRFWPPVVSMARCGGNGNDG